MSSRELYFEAENLEVWLGDRRVFTDLSLHLRRGEHAVVLGPNGSGKSSLIKLLSRELYPVVKHVGGQISGLPVGLWSPAEAGGLPAG